ncbi:MAG: hypothetical protein PHX16_01395 [Syntrophaceticus sp.]|nr:hypothetical protein [Syntrophaceticus sp.]MDD3314000.1 hypothetical protein [Syntrophaceticus sp.]MDD4359309.1 hypothetical protein [Syntrophaceticus sp.]MDD4782287.1 hypothetical protein [Syntrophaceticus sp.]
MCNDVAVGVRENIFCGRITNLINEEEAVILLKQSTRSDIELIIPISEIEYIVTMDGNKYERPVDVQVVLEKLQRGVGKVTP